MGATDKLKNTGQKLEGEFKEKLGQVTHDSSTEAEGKKDKVMGDLKQAGEKVKDAFR